MTGGLVTPTLLDAMLEAGYDRPFEELPHLTTLSPAPVKTTAAPLTVVNANEASRTITLPPGLGLDFGGVAKGWAAHQAMERLQAEGPALVDAAGDIAISGPRAGGGPWQIGVADPFRKGEEIQGQYGSDRRGDPARAGRGALLEHSIHDLDILHWLLGPVRLASGVVREVHGLPRIDDVAVARLDFASGAVASLVSVWHDVLERPSNRRVEIFCERLFVAIEGDLVGPVRFQFTGEPEQCLEGAALRDALRAKGDDVANPATVFLSAVRDGPRADPDFAAALPAHRLADAIYASAEAGGAPVTEPCR